MIFENEGIWNYIRKYCENRAVRFGYWSEKEEKLKFHVYDSGTNGESEKGLPYANLGKGHFQSVYAKFSWITEQYYNKNPVAIYATLSRFSRFPLIEQDFGSEMGRWCIGRDLGFDIDFEINKISELEKILKKSHEIVQPIWDTLLEKKLKPTLKSSGSGWHILAPIEIGHGDTSELVQKLGKYLIEYSLGKQKFERNYFRAGDCRIEVHKDLTRVFSIPFSAYPKVNKLKGTEFKDKLIYCVPLSKPDEILNFEPLTGLEDIRIPDYPEPVELPYNLVDEACRYVEARDFEDKIKKSSDTQNTQNNTQEVCLDNLPQKYRHLENGVKEGYRDESVCTLIGMFKTCGLGEGECLSELMKFNGRCNPPLDNKIIEEKVRRFYRK